MSDENRQRANRDFLNSLTQADGELLRPIYNPEAFIMREKIRGAASRGEIPDTGCRHPLALIRQYVDDDPAVKRNSRPVNLFECGQCHMLIWFVTPDGEPISDD